MLIAAMAQSCESPQLDGSAKVIRITAGENHRYAVTIESAEGSLSRTTFYTDTEFKVGDYVTLCKY